eukprot:IDg19940t1
MASSALPIYGAVGTSLSLLDRVISIVKEYKERLSIEENADNVCELYERVKRELTLVQNELSQYNLNERNTKLETLLRVVNDHIEQAESAVTRLKGVSKTAKTGGLPSMAVVWQALFQRG